MAANGGAGAHGLPGAAGVPGGAAGGGFPAGPGRFGSPFGGGAGLGRLFAADVGGQIAWLLPAALALLVIGLVLTARSPRADRLRASLLLWGGWTVVSALVLSLMEGIFHQYYTVALAPGIAALVGIGGALLWQRRAAVAARVALAVLVVGTAGWAWLLLGRTPEFAPWARWVVVALGLVGALLLLLPARGKAVAAAALAAVVGSALLGPAAYAADTVAIGHQGGIVLAGPATAGGFGGFRGDRAARGDTAAGSAARGGMASGGTAGVAAAGSGTAGVAAAGSAASGSAAGGSRQGQAAGPGGPGFGGPGESQPTDPALVGLLKGAGTKWAAATVGTMQAAPLALSSGTDVMAIGGFSGGDPAPTLTQFQSYVRAGQVHYFLAGGGFGGGPGGPGNQPGDTAAARRGGERGSSTITTWVEQHFTATTVGGRTVYDLTKPKS